MSKRATNLFNDMIMIENILENDYNIYNISSGFIKYQNNKFDIFLKNKKPVLVRDKRIPSKIIIYNDLHSAYVNIFNIH